MWPFKKKPDRVAAVVKTIEQMQTVIGDAVDEINAAMVKQRAAADRANSELHGRLTKLEVFFADEIKAKEAERDVKVKEARARALGH